MKKKNMKNALRASLQVEKKHIADRFAAADLLLSKKEYVPVPEVAPVAKKETAAPKAVAPKERPKVVRDTYSMLKSDFELVGKLRMDCLKEGVDISRSELVRAAINQLAKEDLDSLKEAIARVPKLKPGRAGA